MPDRKAPKSSPVDETRLVRDLVGKRALPEGVKRFDVEFGEDSTGTPAVWIVFTIDDDLQPSRQKVSALTELSRAVTDELVTKGMGRWPYVQFRAAAKAG